MPADRTALTHLQRYFRTPLILTIALLLAVATTSCALLPGNNQPAPTEALPELQLPPTLPPTNTPEPTPTLVPTQPPPTPTPQPSPTPVPLNTPKTSIPDVLQPNDPRDLQKGGRNICDRTPEVQAAIIHALDQVGPQLPCSLINPAEMYRLRSIEIDTPALTPSDLLNLPNIVELTITTRVDKLLDITPGTFDNMNHLSRLNLNISHPPTSPLPTHSEQLRNNLFTQIPQISHLAIAIDPNSPSFLVTKDPFRGLSRLSTIKLNHIHAIDPNAFDLMKGLRSITLVGQHELEPTKQQTLPPDIFKNQLHLQTAEIQGLRFPGTVTLASFEAACHAHNWLPKDSSDDLIVEIFVDRQKVDRIKPGPEDKTQGCLLRVGDNRLIEVLR